MISEQKIIIDKKGVVYLSLPGNAYKSVNRHIGYISDNIFHTERNSSKHLLRIDNSLGFNYKLIKECSLFQLVCVNFDFREVWTSKNAILKYGVMRKFSKGALELQTFLQLRFFKECKNDALIEVSKLDKYIIPTNKEIKRVKSELMLMQEKQTSLFV